MRRLGLCLVALFFTPICTDSFAQDQLWYYCSTTHEFYPHVQNCSVPWKSVHPYKAVPLGQPTNIVPQAGPESTPEQPDTAAQEEQNLEDAREADRAKEQADAQARVQRAQDEHDQAIEKAKAKGYELIPSVKDLILDGKELAARSAKIQITGFYRKIGETGVLYASPVDAYSNDDNYFPVLTEDAQRALRSALMDYPCQGEMGCQIEVGGHVTMCEHTDALHAGEPSMPCLNVEVAIVYRPGD